MKLVASSPKLQNIRLEICEEKPLGFYLYIYDGDRCIRDYLQDDLAAAKRLAREMYGTDDSSWKVA